MFDIYFTNRISGTIEDIADDPSTVCVGFTSDVARQFIQFCEDQPNADVTGEGWAGWAISPTLKDKAAARLAPWHSVQSDICALMDAHTHIVVPL